MALNENEKSPNENEISPNGIGKSPFSIGRDGIARIQTESGGYASVPSERLAKALQNVDNDKKPIMGGELDGTFAALVEQSRFDADFEVE